MPQTGEGPPPQSGRSIRHATGPRPGFHYSSSTLRLTANLAHDSPGVGGATVPPAWHRHSLRSKGFCGQIKAVQLERLNIKRRRASHRTSEVSRSTSVGQ